MKEPEKCWDLVIPHLLHEETGHWEEPVFCWARKRSRIPLVTLPLLMC